MGRRVVITRVSPAVAARLPGEPHKSVEAAQVEGKQAGVLPRGVI